MNEFLQLKSMRESGLWDIILGSSTDLSWTKEEVADDKTMVQSFKTGRSNGWLSCKHFETYFTVNRSQLIQLCIVWVGITVENNNTVFLMLCCCYECR